MDILDVQKLTFAYPDTTAEYGGVYLEPALKEASFCVAQGDFLVILGSSGCGKTTLLKLLKPVLAPHGKKSGSIFFNGADIESLSYEELASDIGFVMQDVNAQLVTDEVWHELAFGLESLGCSNSMIKRRVAEMTSFFGLSGIFHKKVRELSGGQKQMVNLASVMAMNPKLLILDEPTSQLDPIAAEEFVACLTRINRELGTTIIMTEHRLEEVLPVCTKVMAMEDGQVTAFGPLRECMAELCTDGRYMGFMTAATRVYAGVSKDKKKYHADMTHNEDEIHANESVAVDNIYSLPVSVGEGRSYLAELLKNATLTGGSSHESELCDKTIEEEKTFINIDKNKMTVDEKIVSDKHVSTGNDILVCKSLCYAYDKAGDDIVNKLTLSVREGEILSISGGNGSGKTTFLKLIAGIMEPDNGRIRVAAGRRTALLPQNPTDLFTRNTVRDELVCTQDSVENEISYEAVADVVRTCMMEDLLLRHPYDLSGGEQQRLALAKLMLIDPDIFLLDEPTKGIDPEFKLEYGDILKQLKTRGKTIIIVSHDIEWEASISDRCALMFDGSIAAIEPVKDFFSGNHFYTTAAARIAGGMIENAITVEDIFKALGCELDIYEEKHKNSRNFKGGQKKDGKSYDGGDITRTDEGIKVNKISQLDDTVKIDNDIKLHDAAQSGEEDKALESLKKLLEKKHKSREKISPIRLTCIILLTMLCGVCFYFTMKQEGLNYLIDNMRVTAEGIRYAIMYGVFILAVILLLICLAPISSRKNEDIELTSARNHNKACALAAFVVICILIPITIWVGITKLNDRKYYFISMLILLEAIIPFFFLYEKRKPKARELVTVATMCALAVAGRAAFFMLPNFNAATAMVIISGVAFGAETGFIVGAVTMLTSNFIFGQGPWTPWQMFAMGVLGYLAGVIYRRRTVREKIFSKLSLCIFGGISCIVVYGGIMNPASVLMYYSDVSLHMIAAAYITGFPFDVVHGTGTVLFLWFAARPFLEKFDRIRTKYAILNVSHTN